MKLFSALLVLALVAVPALAQISKYGVPESFNDPMTRSFVKPIRMPEIDVNKLMDEDLMEPKDMPPRFAYGFEVSYDTHNSGIWEPTPSGGRMWRISFSSPGALSLGLYFDKFWLPTGSSLFVYSEDRTEVLGAFTSDNNKNSGDFAIRPCSHDTIVIEYNEEANVDSSRLMLSIARVNHGYKSIGKGSSVLGHNDSGRCNINTRCVSGWENEYRASAMILTAHGSRLCSGSMINNNAHDSRQLFLTANHCLGGESSWIFMFNYESASCDQNLDGPTDYTVQGSKLLAKRSASDFALLELEEPIPSSYNVYLAGFNAEEDASTGIRAIHHPSGDIKKTSWYEGTAVSDSWSAAYQDTHWKIPAWTDGTTEPGSSGSPIFDSDHRIIGQLHGGTASCYSNTYDKYGKVATSWNAGNSDSDTLQPHLDPNNTGNRSCAGMELNSAAVQARYSKSA